MSKLRCYERNYGREGIIDFVRYSRKQRTLEATGTENVPAKELTFYEIHADHYDQARSCIDRIQARIPGLTAKKTMKIRGHQNGL